ncbi:MAG: serine hydrolase [Candidatus Dormibacteria bacterium]
MGTRTTARETVALLQVIWTDRAGPTAACARVRTLMAQQLTRHRIASGFAPPVIVAAKGGGLMGIVRNEAAVVRFPDGTAFAVAVFTRVEPERAAAHADIDAGIGTVARLLVDRLRGSSLRGERQCEDLERARAGSRQERESPPPSLIRLPPITSAPGTTPRPP